MNPAAFESGMMLRGRHPSQVANGIAQGRNDMMLQQMIEQRQERTQREADAGKAAEFFVKAQPAVLMELGMDDKAFKNLGAREKASAVAGIVQAQAFKSASAKLEQALKEMEQGGGPPTFFSRQDVGKLIPVEGADGYGLAVTGPNQSQAFYTGKAKGSSIPVPGVGDVGIIEGKPGQYTMVPGQETQGQVREKLAKAEADIAKLRTKLKADPELGQYLGGALAEQESLANSYREALGGGSKTPNTKTQKPMPMPAVGEVRGGYRFKGGNPKDKANWEAVGE